MRRGVVAKPPPDDEAANDGSTAFVRVEDLGGPRGKSAPLAPRKGLQVQLPDDEPPPPPKPKPQAAAPAGKKGRRGNWWEKGKDNPPDDEETTEPAGDPEPAPEEPPEDDGAGATAFLRAEVPPPAPRRRAPEPEAQPAEDNRTQFYRPDEAVLGRDVQKERPPPPPPQSAAPWKLVGFVLGLGLAVVLLGVALVYREAIFQKKPARPPAAAERSDSEK